MLFRSFARLDHLRPRGVVLEGRQLLRRLRRVADDTSVFRNQRDPAGGVLSEAVRFLVEGRLAEHGQRQQVGDEARFVRQPLRGGVPLPYPLFEIIPAGAALAVPAPRPGSVPVLVGADAGSEEPAERFDPVQGENLVEVRVRYKQGLDRRSALVLGRYTRSIERAQASAKARRRRSPRSGSRPP